MIVEPPIEELLPHVKNRFDLSIVVAKRNRQLNDGAEPLVSEEGKDSLMQVAAKELADDMIVAVPGVVNAEIPLRQEIIDEMNRELEEDEEDDWQSQAPDEVEPTPTPVSRLQVMSEEDMFEMPEELEDEDEDEDEDEEFDDEDDVEVVSLEDYEEEDEDELIDDDLESIDSSIDDSIYGDDDEESDDLLSAYEDYDDYDE